MKSEKEFGIIRSATFFLYSMKKVYLYEIIEKDMMSTTIYIQKENLIMYFVDVEHKEMYENLLKKYNLTSDFRQLGNNNDDLSCDFYPQFETAY